VNLMDILLILIFFGALATGFFQGAIRLLVLMLAFYLALVLASLYYPALGEFFVRNFDAERFVGQYLAFFSGVVPEFRPARHRRAVHVPLSAPGGEPGVR